MSDEEDFVSWMASVDRHIGNLVGLISADLPDATYRDWYDDGLEPEEAAEQVLEDAGFDV